MHKDFFWKDKSGRGITAHFNESELAESFKDEVSYDGQTIEDWLEEDPIVGETWENAANMVMRIR